MTERIEPKAWLVKIYGRPSWPPFERLQDAEAWTKCSTGIAQHCDPSIHPLYTADQIREMVERADAVMDAWLACHEDTEPGPGAAEGADRYRAALLAQVEE